MDKVLYLIGTGATRAEAQLQGKDYDFGMCGIGKRVYEMSKETGGKYSKLIEDLGIDVDQDIELMISLLEGFGSSGHSKINSIRGEARLLFRKYLINEIRGGEIVPRILGSLLNLHKENAEHMGEKGEELSAVLTINFDTLIDDAFMDVYGGVNYGYDFTSTTFKKNTSAPPFLKLHGSFNWRIEKDKLFVEKNLRMQTKRMT